MTGRRAIVGLCMLCALLVSAFAAQSASAVTKGTTAFTCANLGASHAFAKEHCTPADKTGGNFEHVAIAENTVTEGRLSNEKTNATTNAAETGTLKSTFGGTQVSLFATGAEATGSLVNKKAASGEHYGEAEGSITFTGVTANHECTVWTDIPGSPPTMGEQGVVHTEPLVGTTKGQGDAVKLEPAPAAAGVFARFWLTNCNVAGVSGTYTIKGSVKGTPEGATITFKHTTTTAEETLLTNGTVPAGIEGKVTLSARASSTDPYKPISPTTVETP